MEDILLKILDVKREEVAELKKTRSSNDLLREAEARQDTRGFANALKERIDLKKNAVIAEIKKASPSKGVIREDFNPDALAISYAAGGAACLSVLTDSRFFQGSHDYLRRARAACSLPVICKDFMVDPYQIYRARAFGADCILLIVAALDDKELQDFEQIAMELKMDALIEVHNEHEMERALKLQSPMIGVNNRDLRTFKTDIHNTLRLKPMLSQEKHRFLITESGILSQADVRLMNDNDIYGFLIGEAFMREEDPGKALAAMMAQS
ncbi:Indole-3-glycerol phosphate synthase [Oligella urethralis]|uniref:indole-3-glycerol phosphate synthase TrpC n=1 Tax=Oligella urethralis TaxID=90245 RepID=UPI000E032C74|nr:indole-3-glycerol phosphate synthase TrpC [Oligella urethralis]SUA64200.1 Indole-3-glycerol phosphate synthase [Oligella urethralis]